ncbi:hypothetical protein AOLI_G00203700 [Acnodon oligacanthus]
MQENAQQKMQSLVGLVTLCVETSLRTEQVCCGSFLSGPPQSGVRQSVSGEGASAARQEPLGFKTLNTETAERVAALIPRLKTQSPECETKRSLG